VRPVLLGACKVCPTLKEELEQARADFEKWSAPSTVCEASLSLSWSSLTEGGDPQAREG